MASTPVSGPAGAAAPVQAPQDSSEVTVLFAQDALDADNFSSASGACDVVKELAGGEQGKTVHFIFDVQTACHDLRLPR